MIIDLFYVAITYYYIEIFSLFSQNEVVKEELEAQQEVLKMMDDKYEDLGPVMDVVVFHDGQQWWAAVDTLESGDLSKATLLTNYCDQRKYGTIG